MKRSSVVRKPPFQLFGIFGDPLKHTLSPRMQEAAFQKAGKAAFYLPFEMNDKIFRKTMRQLPHLLLDGFNVTVPHKETVLPFLDQISEEARVIGAVNTVYPSKNRWMGTNTDAYGFSCSLKKDAKFFAKGKRALVLGAGGSARAVLYALCKEGIASIHLINRNEKRAKSLTDYFKKYFPKTQLQAFSLEKFDFTKALKQTDLVVQTTSVGLKSEDAPLIQERDIMKASAGQRLCVIDLIYKPAETALLQNFKNKGHQTVNGLGMLLYQGAKAFEIWTNTQAPIHEMRLALMKGLAA